MLPERRLPCGTPWQSCSFGIAEETQGGAGAEVGGGGFEGVGVGGAWQAFYMQIFGVG